MSSLPSTTTQEPEGMRNGSTSSRISTFPVNEHVKLVSCDEQKGNLALFTFCDICFFMFLQQTYQFSIFFPAAMGHVSRRGHRAFDTCGTWDISINRNVVTVHTTGWACADAPEVNKRWDDFVYQGRETWTIIPKNSVKFNALPKKLHNHNTDQTVEFKIYFGI